MSAVDKNSNHHSIQVEEEEGGGEEEEGACERRWYMIPRAALRRPSEPPRDPDPDDRASSLTSSTATLSNSHVRQWLDRSPTHSNTSTQSGSSGSLLLTAANLAALRLEAGAQRKDPDTTSLASSTHFTVVNYGRGKPTKRSICAKHTVSALVITTCSIFLLGLTAAIYYIDMRSKFLESRYS